MDNKELLRRLREQASDNEEDSTCVGARRSKATFVEWIAADKITTLRARLESARGLIKDLKERRWILKGDEDEFCGYAACWSNRLEGLLDVWLAEDGEE